MDLQAANQMFFASKRKKIMEAEKDFWTALNPFFLLHAKLCVENIFAFYF